MILFSIICAIILLIVLIYVGATIYSRFLTWRIDEELRQLAKEKPDDLETKLFIQKMKKKLERLK